MVARSATRCTAPTTSTPVSCSAGTNIATIASTAGSSTAAASACSNSSAVASGRTSAAGRPTSAHGADRVGRHQGHGVGVAHAEDAIALRQRLRARAAARRRTSRKRCRCGSRRTARTSAPRPRAADRVPRTECPSGTPWVLRPALTATIGLCAPSRRAMRLNLRGLPIDSRYSITSVVASSSSQYCSRSLPLTSARLPADTKVEMPSPRRVAASSRATPSAPDCAKKPSGPRPRHVRRQRGVEADLRVGVDEPEGVRADHSEPVRPGGAHEGPLRRPPLGSALGEPGRHHDQPVHAGGRRVVDRPPPPRRWHRDDCQVDLTGNRIDRRVGRDPGDGAACGLTPKTEPVNPPSTMWRSRS